MLATAPFQITNKNLHVTVPAKNHKYCSSLIKVSNQSTNFFAKQFNYQQLAGNLTHQQLSTVERHVPNSIQAMDSHYCSPQSIYQGLVLHSHMLSNEGSMAYSKTTVI